MYMPTEILVYPACVSFVSLVAHMISQLFHLVSSCMLLKHVFPFMYLSKQSLQHIMRLDT